MQALRTGVTPSRRAQPRLETMIVVQPNHRKLRRDLVESSAFLARGFGLRHRIDSSCTDIPGCF